MARTSKRRTAAQRRATAKLVAFNRSRRRKNPIARKRRSPRAVARVVAAAPARRRRNPIRRAAPMAVTRRRRRNPVRRAGILDRMVFPAVTAAGGALALDALWAYLPIPIAIKGGAFKHVAKAGAAIALTWGAEKVVSKQTASQIGMGALTVVFHQAAREFMAAKMPQIAMDGMGWISPAMVAPKRATPGMGYFPSNQMGYYPPEPQPMTSAPVESEANFKYS